MTHVSAWADLMPATITVAERTTSAGTNSLYGVPTYSTQVTEYPCRVVRRFGETRTRDGEVITLVADVWIASTGELHPNMRFTLEDGSTPSPLVMEQFTDENGPHHWKIRFGYRRGDR